MALHPTLKHTFILQKGEGWTSRELAEGHGNYSGARQIQNLPSAREDCGSGYWPLRRRNRWCCKARTDERNVARWPDRASEPGLDNTTGFGLD